jgi:hypothetical protein
LEHKKEALARLINLQEGSYLILFEKIKSTKIDLKKNHIKKSKKQKKESKTLWITIVIHSTMSVR